MALSPAHQWGQIIGNLLEAAVEPLLQEFADQHGHFLDKKGPRAARGGRKVTWTDLNGNKHDLDFVVERGGSNSERGTPVAFIETAWRRHTKHSRNKVQEIQGAIMPVAATYADARPFVGAVLAGVFTDGSLQQLRSLGFQVVYLPYQAVMDVFDALGFDARYTEQSPDEEVSQKISTWRALSTERRNEVKSKLLQGHEAQVGLFMNALTAAVTRTVEIVRILPLHGAETEWGSVEDAVAFIERYNEANTGGALVRYDIEIRYSNGDRIEGQFENKAAIVQFLRSFQRVVPATNT